MAEACKELFLYLIDNLTDFDRFPVDERCLTMLDACKWYAPIKLAPLDYLYEGIHLMRRQPSYEHKKEKWYTEYENELKKWREPETVRQALSEAAATIDELLDAITPPQMVLTTPDIGFHT